MIRRIAYLLAILTAGLLGTVLASLLPITDTNVAWVVCVSAGLTAAFTTQAVLPCPCHRTRKDAAQ
ncbi:hypothetical protein ACWDG1_09465 [Streptomyces sp. NPDC001177]